METCPCNRDTICKDDPIIKTEVGLIHGQLILDSNGRKCYCFMGIPYAKPPIGDLRFKPPVSAEPFQDVFEALKEPPQCYHRHPTLKYEIDGSEDCLYLNVYTPDLPICSSGKKISKYPVMVYIHGGFFITGSGSLSNFGPEYLLTHDVVIVTINYRLGILGFLSFEDKSLGIPGNAGLKDQVMALKWVKKNIRAFCGNPNNITLFGQDAGAASVHLHILSPMSKGLFHKAIMQSGCALNPWVNGYMGNSKLLANVFNIDPEDEKGTLNLLKSLTTAELYVLGQERIMNPFCVSEKWVCSPVVETQSKEPAFLSKKPIDIILSGNYNHVPMIFGYNDMEGMFFDILNILKKGRSELIKDFTTIIPNNVNCYKDTMYSENISSLIKRFYYRFTRDDPYLGNKAPIFHMMTDTFFFRGIDSSVRNHLNTAKCKIYSYRFSFDGALNLCKRSADQVTKYLRYRGAAHGDELFYIFHTNCAPPITADSKEGICISRMIKMWTNFAYCGQPVPFTDEYFLTVDWRPQRKKCQIVYLDISSTLIMRLRPDFERMQFWNIIYKNDIRTKFL